VVVVLLLHVELSPLLRVAQNRIGIIDFLAFCRSIGTRIPVGMKFQLQRPVGAFHLFVGGRLVNAEYIVRGRHVYNARAALL